MEKKLFDVEIGKTFEVAGIEFIKFTQEGDRVIAVAKDNLFRSDFGKNNNLADSKVLKKLNTDILPKIEEAVGAENVLKFETDLLSLDGSDKHGTVTSKISLPTFDFYRANVKIFDKYKPDYWWWLATPESTTEHCNDNWICCVSPGGYFNNNYYGSNNGVRPFLNFVSSISVSCKD